MMIQSKWLFKCFLSILVLSYGFHDALALNANWKSFHANEKVSMFYNPKSVKGKGVKTVEVALDFDYPQKSPAGKLIQSVRMIQNYDCSRKRFRLKSAINYADGKLKGKEVARGSEITPWRSIPSGVPYAKLLTILCK
tara:strand:- start:14330 stop:14743 length:414 start_codon:yes stop_codon:yes gene_type:complete